MDKPFKTHEELLNLLESRGMDFSADGSRSEAKVKLQRVGYYTLINGYGALFKENSQDKFKKGTTLKEIYSLYYFDKRLREIFLRYILQFEANIKALIAYYFPAAHKENHYLIYTNFDTTKKDSGKNITDLISKVQYQIADRCSDPSISHYLNNYGYIPLWVLNGILTLGITSKFYSLMLQPERQQISKTFHLSDNELENILFYISYIRNFCAHGNRLYCFRSKRPLTDTTLHQKYSIPKSNNNEYLYGKRDLFAAVIGLRLVLPEKEYRRFIEELDIAIKKLISRLNTISEQDILSSMGFPNDWKAKSVMKV